MALTQLLAHKLVTLDDQVAAKAVDTGQSQRAAPGAGPRSAK